MLQITLSRPSDLPEVLILLREAQLPIEGVADHFADFLLARTEQEVIGCVGLERYGALALLRSLAVLPAWRKQKIGVTLTEQILAYAKANATSEVILLTNSAEAFFARHFGFRVVSRKDCDEVLYNSAEWTMNCCASATCMALTLTNAVA